jgi:hypothetical protein
LKAVQRCHAPESAASTWLYLSDFAAWCRIGLEMNLLVASPDFACLDSAEVSPIISGSAGVADRPGYTVDSTHAEPTNLPKTK